MTHEKMQLEVRICELLGVPPEYVRAVGINLDAREEAEVTIVLTGEIVDRLIAALAKGVME